MAGEQHGRGLGTAWYVWISVYKIHFQLIDDKIKVVTMMYLVGRLFRFEVK
jgi:hypothetical protein